MQRLYKGIQKFQQLHHKKDEEFYSELSKGQSPDVLFFACSDSRVDPNLITQSKPGELFIVKNVGNIIPANGPRWNKSCTAAAIEFSLLVLKVPDIVICGHSDCGAMKALYYDEKDFSEMPNLRDWVNTAKNVKDAVEHEKNPDPSYKARKELTEKMHVMLQIENLMSYPIVREAVEEEKLTLHGWYYDIKTGLVHAYDRHNNTFEPIQCEDDDLIGPVLKRDSCSDAQ